jgi:hypothetical protein
MLLASRAYLLPQQLLLHRTNLLLLLHKISLL